MPQMKPIMWLAFLMVTPFILFLFLVILNSNKIFNLPPHSETYVNKSIFII